MKATVKHTNLPEIASAGRRSPSNAPRPVVIAWGSPAQRGFTLIELMVVVIIVAILAAVAIPSYRDHVIKSNRAAAEGFMLQVANAEEQYMLNARVYTDVIGAGGLNLTPPDKVGINYNFKIINVTATGYTITATPTAVQNDTHCGTLTLDQAGQKGASTSNCW